MTSAILFALSLLSSPLAHDPVCLSGLVTVHVAHEWGHDLAAVAVGTDALHPFLIHGDKWQETQAGFDRIAQGGLIGQTWLAATTLNPCLAQSNRIGATAYASRASVFPHEAGDYDPFSRADRAQIAGGSLLSAAVIDMIADARRRSR